MSGAGGRRGRGVRRVIAGGVVPVLSAGALVAGLALATGPAAQAAAGRAVRAAGQAAAGRAAGRPGGGPALLSAAQASARAQAAGRPVVASALTTPTSQTTARPGGLFTVTQTLEPVRAFRDGAWRALNPGLRANANGSVSPLVTTGGLVLSGGGTAPLAVMTSYGRSLSLWWPGRLPAPVLSGATATYTNVLPGVNLSVTANPQGGFSDVLIIKNAAAAADPALASLRMRASAAGLQIEASPGGNLRVAASATAQPVFTALAPQAWDSAPPAAGTDLVPGPGGAPVAAPSGLPAYSTASAPGVGARVWQVPLSASGKTITLAPPRAALTGRGLVFPVYIDPSFETDPVGGKADNWTQVDSGFPTTSYWDESSYLQLGYCDFSGCNGLGVARDFIKMPISTELTTSTHVNSAYMYMTDIWSASCTAEEVELWTTGTISSSTTWDKQPSFLTDLQNQSFAHGYSSSCPYTSKNVTWTITSVVQTDAGHVNNETFGLKAGSESNDLYWKQFESGSSNITMTTNFHNPPDKPADLGNAPAGSCETSYASESTIGADDVTLSATVGDVDNAEGDDSLTTTFTVKSYATGDTVYTASVSSGNAAGGLTVSPATISRTTIEGWQSDGSTTEYSYYWYASTKDDGSPVLTSAQSDTCYFLYNPLGPAAPGISVSSSTVAIGTTFSATLTPPSGCSATTTPCPTGFTYQMGVGQPVTVTPNNSPASGDWTGNITMGHVGAVELTAYGTASGGNPGATVTQPLTGTPPTTPYLDGYFTGGSYPSLLTPGTGKDPSLWLSAGTGNGTVAAPVDIGSLGTGINPGTDGPGDWADALALHGNFTGDGVQDAMAYYWTGTHAGNAVIIGGQGDASPLIPSSGNNWLIMDPALSDPFFGNPADVPSVLVGAGDASETATGLDDLIGILGDSTYGYELDLFSTSGANQCGGDNSIGGYGYCQTLSTTAPDGTADWNNYALAAAQPQGNSSEVVLFALDKTTGVMYESVNPTCNTTDTTGCKQGASDPTETLVGMAGTWTTLSAPWGSTAPDLISADVNNAGSLELWTLSGGTAIPYTISGTTITEEGSGSPVTYPGNDWQLNDGSPYELGNTATTAVDSITGDTAQLNGTCSWPDDDYFGTVASFDGSTCFISPPENTIPTSDTSASISIWFKTTATNGVLVSVQSKALASGSTITAGYNPILYVGTDGLLQAEWWPASQLTSKAAVDDGLWHHAVLTDSGGTETLTLDGVVQDTGTGTVNFTGEPYFVLGAGYIGGGWPDEIHHEQDGNTAYPMYLNGELADVTLTDS
jgi:Concanavalin A-like lectin/glucanases superfamily